MHSEYFKTYTHVFLKMNEVRTLGKAPHIVFAAPKGTVFASYRSKKQMAGIDFAQILSGIGYGSVERYLSFEFKMSKKERLNSNGSF